MGVVNVEDLSWESYRAILDMVDEMERNGLVKLALERAEKWIKENSNCQYNKDFYYRPFGELK